MFVMDGFVPSCLRADQYRARAEFIRLTAETVNALDLRQRLLDLAEEYDRRAEQVEMPLVTDAA
jgi:hypothetical protein